MKVRNALIIWDWCATGAPYGLAHLDKRYRTRYGLSVRENLLNIKEIGTLQFVEKENQKWTCPECGSMLCMHQPKCLTCGTVWMN